MICAKTLVSIHTFTPDLRSHTTSCSCLETKCRNSQSLACKSIDAGNLQTDLITARNYLIEIFHKRVVCCTICTLNTGLFSLSFTSLNVPPDLDSSEVLQLFCGVEVLCYHPVSSCLHKVLLSTAIW